MRRGRSQPRPRPDDRRRRVRRCPHRRPGHGEHRAHLPRRRRPLASRGRPAPPRARGRGRVLDLRRRSRRHARDRAVGAPPRGPAGVGLDPAGRRRDVPRPLPSRLAGVRARRPRRPRDRRAALTGHRGRPDAECAACRGLRMVAGEPRARPVDGRAPVHVGRSPCGRRTSCPPPPRRRPRRRRRGDLLRRSGRRRPDRHARVPLDRRSRRRRHRAQRPRQLRPGHRRRPLGGLRRGRPARARRLGGDAGVGPSLGGGRRRDRPARARRASLDPVRDRLGPADGRVRGRASLVEALHARLGTKRPAVLGPGHARARAAARLAAPDRGLAGALPRRPRPARLVQDGPLQRALLPRRRRLVLGARRGRTAGAARRPHRPVRAPRVSRLPVLRHGRRRLLRVLRDPGALPRARDGRDPRPARRDPGRRPRDRHDRGVRRARAPQGGRHGAPRRRRTRRRPVLPSQSLPLPGRQRLEGPGPEVRAAGLAGRRRRWSRRRCPDPRGLADRRTTS